MDEWNFFSTGGLPAHASNDPNWVASFFCDPSSSLIDSWFTLANYQLPDNDGAGEQTSPIYEGCLDIANLDPCWDNEHAIDI
jgi:hypothetical protein